MFDPSLLSPLSPMAAPDQSSQQQPPWVPLETNDCSQGFCTMYCPQWCYIVFPPPPPFFIDDDTSSGGPTFSPLVIAIIGILLSAFILVGYYTVISKFCSGSFCRRRRRGDPVGPDDEEVDEDAGRQSGRHEEWHIPPTVGLDEALINKITVCKYRRGDGLVDCSDCSVCLSEFREDESLRLLPKCSHAFHVQCIDTWLKSHSNCPLCRANIVLINPAPPQFPAPVPPPVTSQSDGARDDEMVVVIEDSDEGTSFESDGGGSSKEFMDGQEENDAIIEVAEDEGGQRMRRSFSMGSFSRSRVSVADILQVDMEDDHTRRADHENLVGGSSSQRSRGVHSKGCGMHCVSPVPMKRSVSSGRFCLTRQARGRNAVLPI